jgi:phage RecT family recombinase
MLDAITKHHGVLAAYLPEGVKPQTYLRQIRDAVVANPDLLACSTNSVLREIARACASGLPIDGKFSSLIVRKSKRGRPQAVWDPTARGMTAMALASGQVLSVQSHVVRQKDQFKEIAGTNPRIEHEPHFGADAGEVIGAYTVVKLASGELVQEVLDRGDLERIRRLSVAGGDAAPWEAWPDEMSRKASRRRALKQLPAAPVRLPAVGDVLGITDRGLIDADSGEIYGVPPSHLSSEDIAAGITRLPEHEARDVGDEAGYGDDDVPF